MTHSIDAALGDRAVFDSLNLGVLLEAMSEAVIITSPGLDKPGPTILFVNGWFKRMTGYDAQEVVGRTPRLLQGPATARPELQRLRQALQEHRNFEGETVNYRKDGSPFRIRWAVAPIYDDFGQVAGWLSVQRGFDEPEFASLTDLARKVERRLEERLAGSQDS